MRFDRIEALAERAVFQMPDQEGAAAIVVAAVEGLCPEFSDRRDALMAMLDEGS